MADNKMLRRLLTLRTRMRLRIGGWVASGRRSVQKWWRRSDMPGQLWAALVNLIHVVTRRDPRRAWRRPWIRRILAWIGWVFAALLLVLQVAAVFLVTWNLITQEPLAAGPMNYVEDRCDETGFACSVGSSIFFTVVPLIVGSFVFVFWRLRRVQRPLVKLAKEQPTELVDTAGEIVGSVVGRDDVCNVLLDSLRERNGRRPYVIVGGVGVGKTAVLVRLTELLGERGAVPVPIRLRDAESDLDFLEMAREAFLRETQSSTWLAAEAERAWGRLRKTDKIVVLADGLEEAFADSTDVDQDRDHHVRAAVRQARKRGYPLVIASREHDALSALDAALLRLEPVNEEAALEYIEDQQRAQDENRLGWIVERASVVETPLYLQIVRELHESGQLRYTTLDTRGASQTSLETRDADRVLLRMNLAEGWINALIAGNLENQAARVPLNSREREAAVLQLAALACCGLANDTLQVTFDMFEKPETKAHGAPTKPVYPMLKDGLEARLRDVVARRSTAGVEEVQTEKERHCRVDMQVAASNGVRLGLVEPRKEGVRFPHSTMQAYLASMLIGEALKDRSFQQAFSAPGREFLIALGMFSRREEAQEAVGVGAGEVSWRSWLGSRLCETARDTPNEVKKLQLLTTAVEVDSTDMESDHKAALAELVKAWNATNSWEEASRDAKMLAVARVGEAARRITQTKLDRGDVVRSRAHELIHAVKSKDPEFAAKLESKLPAEYSASTLSCNDQTDIDGVRSEVERNPRHAQDDAIKTALERLREAVAAVSCSYLQLYRICCKEDSYQIRLAAAQEIGLGGQVAFNELRDKFPEDKDIGTFMTSVDEVQADPDERYSPTVRAWLLPMLVGSADKDDSAAQELRKWLEHVGDKAPDGKRMPLFLEAALAQGFKSAANRRPQHPYEMAKTRSHLAARAEQMFDDAQHWYSRLTLLHALCLWALAGTLPTSRDPAERGDPRAVVKRWMRRDDGKPQHPFVCEASELVIKALETKEPERFLWIDESSIVTTVGSRSKRKRAHTMRTLWIPPSAGWLVLDRHAQQLVADVLILLTLAERGDTADDWAGNLGRINGDALPLCLSEDRGKHLRPTDTAGVTQSSPGDTCKSGCHVGLCPYPPKGQQPYRVELGEAFCRKQRELLLSRRAAWQNATRTELRQFWRKMEERART